MAPTKPKRNKRKAEAVKKALLASQAHLWEYSPVILDGPTKASAKRACKARNAYWKRAVQQDRDWPMPTSAEEMYRPYEPKQDANGPDSRSESSRVVASVASESSTRPRMATTPYMRPTGTAANPDSTLQYPTGTRRLGYKLPTTNKPLSSHQFKVYDYLINNVPAGKVTTYAELAHAIGSSPRAVGGALRENPFAPEVPCHRVVSSKLELGGFQGEWSTSPNSELASSAGKPETKLQKKARLLREEGVMFDSAGKISDTALVFQA
ncbi:hypothetical protein OIV83_003695 [Microbotryomycetes sp. JL201]|nr:hypothetical protein OIV83_003695 [Microbotryomycetes sp. JL201]